MHDEPTPDVPMPGASRRFATRLRQTVSAVLAARLRRAFAVPAVLAAGTAVVLAAAGACGGAVGNDGPSAGAVRDGASLDDVPDDAVRTVAEGLDTPWEVRFLPGGDLLVTERGGDLVRIAPAAGSAEGDAAADGAGRVVERHEIPGVREVAEAGLMGLALHPDYPATPGIYVCHTTDAGGGLENRVVRFRLEDGRLTGRSVVLDGMAAAPVHDGCRLEFGPEGRLFVTMGDAGSPTRAQDRDALNGKILRIGEAGEAPSDNPFDTRVWSWGHRNPQGLTFDDDGRLWSTEHGPSGVASGRDELNLVEAGGNYGWPEITGDQMAEGIRTPVLQSGADTWAPAGLAHVDDRLFFGGLAGETLYEVRGLAAGASPEDPSAGDRSAGAELELIRHFAGELGRIRAVRVGPDGRLHLATSNRDGRGSPREGDDRIVSVDPAAVGGR